MTASEDLIALIPADGGFLTQVLIDGLTGVTAGIAMALPYVFLFYIILGLTEDIGLLPRFVVNVQRTLRFFHIPERGFISLMLGLGCTVPAVTSTRIMRECDQRVRLIFLYAFVPCSSRLGIILGVVAFYGGDRLVLPLFATLGMAALFWLLIMRMLSKDELDPILLELPAYRRPMISNVAHKSWLRMREFVVVVIPLLILGGVAYSLIVQLGVTAALIGPFAFVTEGLLGLPAETIIPILFGFVQKDLTGAMLVSVLGGDVAAVMTPLQLFTFGVVTSIGIPCMIVLPAMAREIGWKNTFVIFATTSLFSLAVASTVWRIALLFGFT
jgi:ferrous iron transport protein B